MLEQENEKRNNIRAEECNLPPIKENRNRETNKLGLQIKKFVLAKM